MTGRVVANEPGAQCYFGEQFIDSVAFPFSPGDDSFRAICIPDADAIVLVDADKPLEFPLTLTLRDPESYRITIEPEPKPDPESDTMTTEKPHPGRSNPGGEPR